MPDPLVAAEVTRGARGTRGAHIGLAKVAIDRENEEQRVVGCLAAVFFLAALLFAIYGWQQGDTFFLRLGTEALIYAGLALSVDLLLGHGGLLSLGHALFFGLGAYVSALILKDVSPSFWLAIAGGTLSGLLAGTVGGIIAIRARGVYFALITFGMAQVVAKIIYNTQELGASDGIIGIPIVPISLGIVDIRSDDPFAFFTLTLVIVAAIYVLLSYATRTPYGRVLSAIRVNESRLPFLGYSPAYTKLGAFVISSMIAGLSGSLYPMLRGFVSPELMYFEVSTNAVIAVVIGGAGTLVGPLFGAMALVFGKSVVGSYTEHHLIVVGVFFMASVIFLPQGFAGFVKDRFMGSQDDRS